MLKLSTNPRASVCVLVCSYICAVLVTPSGFNQSGQKEAEPGFGQRCLQVSVMLVCRISTGDVRAKHVNEVCNLRFYMLLRTTLKPSRSLQIKMILNVNTN